MEINIKEEIIILDEAHNIEDSAREAVSKCIEHDSLTKIIKELDDLGEIAMLLPGGVVPNPKTDRFNGTCC